MITARSVIGIFTLGPTGRKFQIPNSNYSWAHNETGPRGGGTYGLQTTNELLKISVECASVVEKCLVTDKTFADILTPVARTDTFTTKPEDGSRGRFFPKLDT